jgi:hypothetical protein
MSFLDIEDPGTPSAGPDVQAAGLARTIADRQAAVATAQRFPRDMKRVLAAMQQACSSPTLAEVALYRIGRPADGGGAADMSATVFLARELARCWTHIRRGAVELHRDSGRGSKMVAFAWDLEADNEATAEFFVPHPPLTVGMSLEQHASLVQGVINSYAARRIREVIFQVLPFWYVEDAKAQCMKTLEYGRGVPLADRIATVGRYLGARGVEAHQLDARIGRPTAEWDVHDVIQAEIIWRSVRDGYATVAQEFQAGPTTVREVLGVADTPEQDGLPAASATTAVPTAPAKNRAVTRE